MMKSSLGKIKLTAWLLAAAGLTFFIALLVREGVVDVFRVVAAAGWGVLLVVAFHLVSLMLDAFGWRPLFPPGKRPRLRTLFWMRWIGGSINNLVPVAQVGGDLVRARLVGIFTRTPMPVAAASVIVNITLNVFTQVIFTFGGFVLLIGMTRQMSLAKPALVGVSLSIVAIGGFYAVQRLGGIRLIATIISRMAGSGWQSLAQDAEALDREVKSVYSRPRDVARCAFWALLSWVAGAGEVWIALHAMGRPAGFGVALAFETMSQGFRTAVFFIPGALGVQEGAYLFVAGLLGFPGQVGMALAMIRRVRELAIGIPAITTWQILEAKHLRRHAREAAATTPFPVAPRTREPVRELISAQARMRKTASRY